MTGMGRTFVQFTQMYFTMHASIRYPQFQVRGYGENDELIGFYARDNMGENSTNTSEMSVMVKCP
jgi:hypothetical protein